MDFSKVIFMTDLDGTLLTDDKRVLPEDMDAIDRFRNGGGIFTMATGRGYSMAKPLAEKLKLNVPAVVFNGTAVFDFNEDKFLWHCSIGKNASDYINRIMERFDDIGIEVLMEQKIYVPFMNKTEREHLNLEKITPIECSVGEIPPDDWLKVLFAAEPSKMDEVEKFVRGSDMADEVEWMRSQPMYFECLPKGIDKAYGFKKLIEILGVKERFTVAAGDYNNDIAMIKAADLGAAPESALKEVKDAADLVVCDNNSGAIAEIIRHIEKL